MKTFEEWDEHGKRKAKLNAKAIYYFRCPLDRTKYNRICQCESTKEIWRLLEVTYEGTNQVKEFKINIFMHSYELFSLRDNEFVVEMFNRFTNITNELQEP